MQSYLTSMKFPSACSRHNLSEGPWFSTCWEIQQNLCPLQLMMPGWWSYIDLVQVAPVSGHFGVLSLWFHSGLNPITAEWTLNTCPGEHDGMAKTWFSRTSAARHWWKSLAPVDIQKKCRFASVYCQHAGTFLTLCLAKCTFHKSQATLRQTNIPLSPRVARFPPTKYGRFLSISSSMLTRQGPPTPTVYCTYIINHRGPKTCYFGKNRRIVIWFTVYCLI